MSNKLTQMPEWKKLKQHQSALKNTHMRDLFKKNPKRFDEFHVALDSLLFDYSKNKITAQTIAFLIKLAKSRKLEMARADLFAGKPINKTEDRAVLHTALRGAKNSKNIEKYVVETKKNIKAVSDQIRNNKSITDVINVGIGGSDLGPRMVCEALKTYADGPNIHFLANIDGAEVESLLKKLKAENTFVIIASKTFTTLETMENAKVIQKWAKAENIAAVTANVKAAEKFGVDKNLILPMKEWIGGRYSLWSAAGLSIAISVGFKNFEQLLKGAQAADEHFKNAPLEKNIPVLMAMLGIWYRNFWDYPGQAVLPYVKALKYFHAYIQQLDMESNGKQADVKTGPIVFGGTGTKVQHAFFQHLHQGMEVTPSDFIVTARPNHKIKGHHTKLIANALAQAQALMQGSPNKKKHLHFEGNRPSSVFILDELSPFTLGMLIAFYEHKIFVQGVVWGINSFDQWGVELGKSLARDIIEALENNTKLEKSDSSTYNLIQYLQRNS